MNSSPLAAIWHWYPLLAWVACARFCSLPLGSLSYLNFYRKLRLDSNFSYGTGLIDIEHPFEQPGPAHAGRRGWRCTSPCSAEVSWVLSGAFGMISGRSLALAASTPWKQIRCNRGRGTRGLTRGAAALIHRLVAQCLSATKSFLWRVPRLAIALIQAPAAACYISRFRPPRRRPLHSLSLAARAQ